MLSWFGTWLAKLERSSRNIKTAHFEEWQYEPRGQV